MSWKEFAEHVPAMASLRVATGVGTRRIMDGKTITVDGGAGTEELK